MSTGSKNDVLLSNQKEEKKANQGFKVVSMSPAKK